MAIASFRNIATVNINYGRLTKGALRLLPRTLHEKARIKLARIGAATSLQDLQELRGNRLEMLQGNRKGQMSIRINDRYRICFVWKNDDAFEVEIVDYRR